MNHLARGQRSRGAREADPNAAGQPDRRTLWISLALLAVTLAAFAGVLQNGFVNYDDDLYVFRNPLVHGGMSWRSLWWACTSIDVANWHPLAWISLQLDSQLFGPRPAGYHATNLALHALSGVLLFHVWRGMTGAVWRSACAAALFALHPLRVESVAWIAERKDVLGALFWIVSMWAYWRYTHQPGWRRYGLLLMVYFLGLASKPTLVTLPFALLLLDYWPLARNAGQGRGVERIASRSLPAISWARLVGEKVPLLCLAAVVAVFTWVGQSRAGALASLAHDGLAERLARAPLNYLHYLGHMFWPARLAVFYPLDRGSPVGQVVAAMLLLAAITFVALRLARSRPYLPVGWFWFLGTLVPMIGVVQVGGQAAADRCTYIPTIGLAPAVCWAGYDAARQLRLSRGALTTVCGLALAACGILTWIQVGYWRDSVTLWRHALEVTRPSAVSCNNLGVALSQQGELEEAEKWLRMALTLDPNWEEAHLNLALLVSRTGRMDEAIAHYQRALLINPDNAIAHFQLGFLASAVGLFDLAVAEFRESLRLDPDNADARQKLAAVLQRLGKSER
jgi:protein O-mannosyl-transferase